MTPQQNWTKIGVEHGFTEDRQPVVEEAIGTLEWHDMETHMRLPFMPGESIKKFVEEVFPGHWTGVDKIAWNGVIELPDPADASMTASYGFYGIEKRYANGRAIVYLVDTGGSTLCVRSDFWPKAAA